MWNRVAATMILVTAVGLLITPIETEARGGGGGGRGGGAGGGRGGGGSRGGGGAYRGGNTMNRTPTMSRASNRPSTSQGRPPQRQQVQTRPSVSPGRVQQGRQTVQQRPSAANKTELRNQINQYAQQRPAQNIDRQDLTQKAQNFSSTRRNQVAQNRQFSETASQRLQQARPESSQWFAGNFFDSHNIDVGYAGRGDSLWRPAAWATLATWGAWNWSTPYYYDDGGYSYPVSTTESAESDPYSSSTTTTAPELVQTQSTQNVQASTTTNGDGDWLPLGVFAVASNASAAAQTNRFIQLAVNRSGEIAGVLYNSTTDAAQDLTGMVYPESQLAFWSLANHPGSPIASTGIYNLTEDQTPVSVHFSDGSSQTWTLVRLHR